jgi:hypothetical protein
VLDFAALDVAIGLIFVYIVLSLVCSALNETVSSIFSWRAKFLREGIANLMDPADHSTGKQLVETLYSHPLINSLIRPVSRRGRQRYPSYIPSRSFVTAVLDFDAKGAVRTVDEAVAAIPSAPLRDSLQVLLNSAEKDVDRFRHSAEQWFDDAMERVSGWYRRRIQLMMWALAAALVLSLNADTIRIAEHLWSDKTVRAAVVARANAVKSTEPVNLPDVGKQVGEIKQLEVPIGWSVETRPHGAGEWIVRLLLKILGLLLTAAALTLGAPFWFDALSKVARLRSAGAPPPATDAVRRGDGEQPRAGPMGHPTLPVSAAESKSTSGP